MKTNIELARIGDSIIEVIDVVKSAGINGISCKLLIKNLLNKDFAIEDYEVLEELMIESGNVRKQHGRLYYAK